MGTHQGEETPQQEKAMKSRGTLVLACFVLLRPVEAGTQAQEKEPTND